MSELHEIMLEPGELVGLKPWAALSLFPSINLSSKFTSGQVDSNFSTGIVISSIDNPRTTSGGRYFYILVPDAMGWSFDYTWERVT